MANRESGKKLFILDTNVLIHDPQSVWHFEEHDIFIPILVLEELDNLKKGLTEIARDVRRASHVLDEILQGATREKIIEGIPLAQLVKTTLYKPTGKIYFQTELLAAPLPVTLASNKMDNDLLSIALALQNKKPDQHVVLVTKDINLRMKATIIGVPAEDYFNDQVIDSLNELRPGMEELPRDFWEKHSKELTSWKTEGRSFYKIVGSDFASLCVNDGLTIEGDDSFRAIIRKKEADGIVIEHARDYLSPKHAVWGINARNIQQDFALNHLLNPDIDLVTMQGRAGTGKTLLSLAASLQQTIEDKRYSEIIMTRVTVPLGEDIGFLPGTEEEKMTPWMGALLDNLEVLHHSEGHTPWEKDATQDILNSYLKIRTLNFMRGRTFLKKFLIIDEAQNLTSKQLKTLITRAGPQTKIVILGDLQQIDTPYLNEVTSGFAYVIDRFKDCEFAAHITLTRGERSRLSDYAAEVM
ncbi:MAG: phosphate starvation protein PhoH [Gammaproteobacteria bacterium]|jgi:PhoH-like ATPase|nr:phosphate starvation protein PhoH [Gammaproteobacteria bacterium]